MVLVFLVVSQVTGERTAIVLGIYYMHRTAFLSVAARGPMVLYTGEPYSRGKCPQGCIAGAEPHLVGG
jgi:hypothetical protein